MNRATSRTLHAATCRDDACDFCERLAEERKADDWPTFDLDAAADQYERSFGL